jgi:Tol biopolymer transport system component
MYRKSTYKTIPISLLSLLIIILACTSKTELDYLGQATPGTTPIVFSPEILGNYENKQSPVFSPDGKSLYITIIKTPRDFSTFFMNKRNAHWMKPHIPDYFKQNNIRYPFVSPDGKKLFFVIMDSPEENGKIIYNSDIFTADIISTGFWDQPQKLEPIINSEYHERSPSVTRDGTLYFYSDREGGMGGVDIYKSILNDGHYLEPENLGNKVNSEHNEYNPFISPDESYLLFNSNDRPDSYGSHDIYVSFRKNDGSWTEVKNLGAIVNTTASESKPYVSPDGKFLFFSGIRNKRFEIFWVDTQIIEELKSEVII